MSMDNPRTHTEREAAQRADEAELLAMAGDSEHCVYCPEPIAAGFNTLCEAHLAMCIPCVEHHARDEAEHVNCVRIDCYCLDCHAPTPADDPAGPGAVTYIGHYTMYPRDYADQPDYRIEHDATGYNVYHDHQPAHTHPCPTCRHDRSCACTTFTPGEPLECATCSNCRGW